MISRILISASAAIILFFGSVHLAYTFFIDQLTPVDGQLETAMNDPVYRAELEKRLAALRPDSPRRWGTMSVDQMLWHVDRTLQLHLGEIRTPRERAYLPRGVMKFLVLNVPWPKGAPTLAALLAKEQQYDFAQERQCCLDLLDRFARRRLDEEWPENPIFGKVSGKDLSRLQAKHLDHHLRQFGCDKSNAGG